MDGRTAARQAGVDQGYIALAFLVLEHAKESVPISSQAKKTHRLLRGRHPTQETGATG